MRLFKEPVEWTGGQGQGEGGVRTMRGVWRARQAEAVWSELAEPCTLGVHTLRSMRSVRSFFSSARFLQSVMKYSRFLRSRMAVSSRYCSWL